MGAICLMYSIILTHQLLYDTHTYMLCTIAYLKYLQPCFMNIYLYDNSIFHFYENTLTPVCVLHNSPMESPVSV